VQFEKARSWTIRDIERIINTNSTEYKNLEFKSLDALIPGSKDEIGKDVSSFANSAGGVIIYGVSEIKSGPDVLLKLEEGRDANDPHGKEWLENIIESNISPKIDGLLINPIKLPNEKYIYVVMIPQSTTAHMSGYNRYYKRKNFKSEPMEDYEVRDVMNRLNKPNLRLIFTIPKNTIETKYRLKFVIKNNGEAFVRHFAVRIHLPEMLIADTDFHGGRKLFLNKLWYREYIKQSSPNQYIFPGFGATLDPNFLPLLDTESSRSNPDLFIYWTIYTDKGSPMSGKTKLGFIIKDRLKE
jgi:hypothetical protein